MTEIEQLKGFVQELKLARKDIYDPLIYNYTKRIKELEEMERINNARILLPL